MAQTSDIPIKDSFSKWFIDGHGKNKVPANFAVYSRNQRVENGATTLRRWFRTLVSDSSGTHIRGITANSMQWNILCCSNSNLKKVNLTTMTLDTVWSIGTDVDINMFNHGKYTIMLTWIGKWWVYDGTTLQQIVNVPDENCIIWCPFAWFTVIAGNKANTSNFIYFSRPVTPTNPEYARDWTGSWSESRNMGSKVLGMEVWLNNLYIFTQNTVEYVGKDSLASVWGTFSFFSSPIGEWDQLLNMNMAVTANDKAFYMTKNFTVKTLNYVAGTVDPSIWQLSDRPMLSIRNFLETQLNDNQDWAFAQRKGDNIFWYLRSINSPIIDIALVYDLTNDNFYIDDDIYYSCMVSYDGKYYAGSYLNSDILEDDVGYDVDSQGIPFEYITPQLDFGNPVKQKLFKWWSLAWEINFEAKITVETIIDWFVVASETIEGSDLLEANISWLWSSPIGALPVGWSYVDLDGGLVWFESRNKQGNVNLKGYNIQLRITSDLPWARFYLDYLSFQVKPIGNTKLQNIL